MTVHHEERPAALKLTSMMDVCFLLLIFFVLTASFSLHEGLLPADLPGPDTMHSPAPQPQAMTIALRTLGGEDVMIELRPGGYPAHFAELHQTLASLKHSDLNPSGPFLATDPVIIESGEHVRWGHVVNAFNQAVRAGYTNINFAQNSR